MKLPPSQKRQDWLTIGITSGVTFAVSYAVGIHYTWNEFIEWQQYGVSWQHFHQNFDGLLFTNLVEMKDQFKADLISFKELLVRQGLVLPLTLQVSLPAMAAAIPAFFIGRRFHIPGGHDGYRHISGSRVYWKWLAKRHAKRQLKRELRNGEQKGLRLHPDVQITKSREKQHLFLLGNTGTGKSQILYFWLCQVLERDARVFIYDEKREYTARFYEEENTILLAPWDARSDQWDIQSDVPTPELAEMVAAEMILETKEENWSSGARAILAGSITALNAIHEKWGWVELAQILSLDEEKLIPLITKYYPAANKLIKENSRTTDSYTAIIKSNLSWVYTLARAWPRAYENGFSICRWLHNDNAKKRIIIQSHSKFKAFGAPFTRTLMALLTTEALAQDDDFFRETWIFIDELGSVKKCSSLQPLTSLGRSVGLRLACSAQQRSMLASLYGSDDAETLVNLTSNVVALRCGFAGNTKQDTSNIFGKRRVAYPTHSTGSNGQIITNWTEEELPVVTEEELTELPQASKRGVDGFLKIPSFNHSVYRLCWPIMNLPIIAEEFMPAQWLTPSKPAKSAETKSVRRIDAIKQRRTQS
jgi:type IV secretory pathway TraG/TraD family ATPase VirD4